MNKERMLELAEELERPRRLLMKFNMRYFIMTHACLVFGEPGTLIGEANAKKLLDLTQDQANRLFYNTDKYVASFTKFADINREQAANAIRRMVAEEGGE